MKKYPKIVQCDARGQIVIPKDIRQDLDIGEGTGFWMFSITDEGILLKLIPGEQLEGSTILEKVKEKADKISLDKKNIEKSLKKYKRSGGNLEEL